MLAGGSMENHLMQLPATNAAGLAISTPLRVIEGTDEPYAPFWVFRDAAESQSGEAELEFFGPISQYSWLGDEITPAKFKKDLYAVGKNGPITVLLNSPGGEVVAASVIRTLLQEYPGRVTVDIIGLAASAATIVATGADYVRMRESAYWMIHDPSTVGWGNIEDFKKILSALVAIKDGIIDVYATRTGLSREKLSRLMSDETWLSAKEAKDRGFIDEVVTASLAKPGKNLAAGQIPGVANCLGMYRNVPAGLLESLTAQAPAVEQPAVIDAPKTPAGSETSRDVEDLRALVSSLRGGKA
jgi:ATP-dependent Clp protease, protease subunit